MQSALSPLDHWICYSVKANSNLAVLRVLARAGCGFDIVSEGELRRVLAAGGDAGRVAFAGVGKREAELTVALEKGIHAFNVESEPELERINRVAGRLRRKAPVAVRVNPDVDAGTHAKITTGTYQNKFGIAFEKVEAVYARAASLKHVQLRGLQMHLGSQLTDARPFELAVRKVTPLASRLAHRYGIEFLNIGGGIGIVYHSALASGDPVWWRGREAKGLLTPATYAAILKPYLETLGLRIIVEPGRSITGNAGILVTRVEYLKKTGRKTFVIVDAAMNDLIRPSLYDAHHEIVPLRKLRGGGGSVDIVGGICESGDYFARDRRLPPVREGEYLALMSVGAYGSVMGSNYNSRPMAAEVLVHGSDSDLVRQRQSPDDLWRLEKIPEHLR
jgi:diaminopimelate decarboxylase